MGMALYQCGLELNFGEEKWQKVPVKGKNCPVNPYLLNFFTFGGGIG
jgi:hypothetical protein